MSDHNEAPSTEDEIEDVISQAKKAAKAQNPNKSGKSKKNRNRNRNRNKTKAQDEESSENLFNEIDSVAKDEDENLSPKMKSAKSFSNAFAAAKEKRENDLKTKRIDQEVSDEEDDEEEAVFDPEDDEDNSAEFEVDSEDEEIEEDLEEDDEEYDGIFETDDENEEYIENVDVDDDDEDDFDDEDDEDYDDDDEEKDDDDDDEGAFSTKAKVIIGIIIAILVLAIIGAGIFFLNRDGGDSKPGQVVTSQPADGSVTGIQFAEPAVSIRVGETIPLEIVVEPEDAKDKVLKLKSNDPAIAKVDESGKLTGVASGSTTVTATLKSNESITASLIVNVIDDNQDAINVYNKFVNSIVDGSTDIDSDTETDTDTDTDSEQQYDEFGNPIESTDTDTDTDSDTDSDSQRTAVAKDVLTGNIIKDLDSDGDLELALLYKGEQDSSKVRIFRLADPNEEEEAEDDEPQYDEYGNLIEDDTDSEAETDTEKKTDDSAPSDKVLTEVGEETELYAACYGTIEAEGASWNTSYIEIKEDETEQAKVTILSSGYESPSYTYESEDQTIATVDNQGNIKAIKPGTTYITVTSPLNSEASAKIKVRVKDDTDLLDDYLAQVPTVNSTNDSVFPTETLTGKAIVDIDNDGISELLLRFDYGNNVQAIEMIKVENEKCVAYKTYNNLSDLYEYSEGDGSYSNSILVHYTSGKVCMEYRAVVAKEDSKTRTTEQKILSVESSGGLSELVNFKTTTDITTKTVTSEVVVEEEEEEETTTYSVDESSSAAEDTDSETWYDGDDDTDSEYSYDDTTSEDEDNNDEDYYYGSYAAFTFDELVAAEDNGINLNAKKAEKKLPEAAGEEYYGDDDEDSDYDNNNDNDNDDDTSSVASTTANNDDDEPASRVTSTVTSEVSEESTKYFVNGTPVEQSVYEETLSTYAARYSVWNAWESV